MEDRQLTLVPMPSKVKVGPFIYTVEVTEEGTADHNNWGEAMHVAKKIKMNSMMGGEPTIQRANTFLHEVIHCVDSCASLKLSEEQVCTLANLLHDSLSSIGCYPVGMTDK